MASRTVVKQIFRSLHSLRYKTSSPLACTTFYGQRILLNGAIIGVPQHNFAKQFSASEITIPIVSYEEIKQLPKQPEKLLIDVREPKELEETGQIPTSINIPLGLVAKELGTNVDAGAFKAKYGREKPQRNTEIIFHCKIGRRSHSAAEIATSLGYQNTKNYLGSWTEWADKEGLPK